MNGPPVTLLLPAVLSSLCACAGPSQPPPQPAPRSAPAPTTASEAPLPIRWAPGLSLKSLARARKRFDAEDLEGFGELGAGEDAVLPTSCPQRAALRAQGYTPVNTLEQQNDDDALVRCGTLELLAAAQAPRVSYLRDLRWDASLLDVLPAALAARIDPARREAADQAQREGKSFRQLDPGARAKPGSTEQSLVIEEGDGNASTLLHAQAFADFDRDGIDDLALSVVNADAHGPYAETRLVVLTRTAPDGPLRVVSSR